MAVKQCKPVTMGPWKGGMNNRASEFDLPEKTLRDAYNVDITNEGRARRRRGSNIILEGDELHSVFGAKQHFLFVSGDTLYYGLPPSHAALRTGLTPNMRMAYEDLNDEVYFSNGQVTGRVLADGSLVPWGVLTPNSSPVVAAVGAGGLFPGRYQVTVVHVAPTGEESGARAPAVVVVADGGGIQLTNIPQPADGYATTIRIYRSQANGEVMYQAVDLVLMIRRPPRAQPTETRKPLATLFMVPMPPCDLLTSFNGRLYGSLGPIVWCSEPMRYGLTRLDRNFFLFPVDVTLLEGVEGGVFLGADATYFMAGATPDDFALKDVLPFPPVPYTAATLVARQLIAWWGEKGYVIGSPDGQAKLATEANLAVPKYTSGAVLYREDRGLRQLVSAMRGPSSTLFEASDFSDATEVRSAT